MSKAQIKKLQVLIDYVDTEGMSHSRKLIDWTDEGQTIEADFNLRVLGLDSEKVEIGADPVRVGSEFQLKATRQPGGTQQEETPKTSRTWTAYLFKVFTKKLLTNEQINRVLGVFDKGGLDGYVQMGKQVEVNSVLDEDSESALLGRLGAGKLGTKDQT